MTLSDLQLQANFPLLASAIALLDRKLRQGKYVRILLSSRDCYMQAHLWRQMFPATPYEIIYWLTSRWARMKGSERYLDYCRELMNGKILIFDLCGTGDSIRELITRLNIESDYLVLQSDPRRNHNRLLDGPGDIEGLNCAPHATVMDVSEDGEPIYSNPFQIFWEKYFENIGGKAFLAECTLRRDYSEFIDAPEAQLLARMKLAEAQIATANSLLEPFHETRRNEDWQ